ncbi:hypothetical protein [Sphingobium boeckii]|uniref:Uncharacterized protein n=1 Tax=Sphingobium boeckii TaxID=1082345 RepID=A0A7W9ED93_9SPHN|nr:hypothetical protein [Sphingobium boeckii]MBB5685038.1 hypothetical protein [Sphingobium boeckii]
MAAAENDANIVLFFQFTVSPSNGARLPALLALLSARLPVARSAQVGPIPPLSPHQKKERCVRIIMTDTAQPAGAAAFGGMIVPPQRAPRQETA